jgi:hypothetical protein
MTLAKAKNQYKVTDKKKSPNLLRCRIYYGRKKFYDTDN